MVFFNGHLQGVPVLVILESDVRPLLQQNLKDVAVAVLGRQVESSRLVIVSCVNIGAVAWCSKRLLTIVLHPLESYCSCAHYSL